MPTVKLQPLSLSWLFQFLWAHFQVGFSEMLSRTMLCESWRGAFILFAPG